MQALKPGPTARLIVYEAWFNHRPIKITNFVYRPFYVEFHTMDGLDWKPSGTTDGMNLVPTNILEVRCNQGTFRWLVSCENYSYGPGVDWYLLRATRI